MPKNDSVYVNSCGGNVFICGTCPQETLSCLSVCEMYFLYAVLWSSWGHCIPGGRFLTANLSFALLLVDSYRTAKSFCNKRLPLAE